MGYLTWWNFPKKAWLIILAQLGVITSLSVWLYLTYLNDVYFQSYTNTLSPVLVPVLSVAFGISSASIATYLYLGMKRFQGLRESGVPAKNRGHRGKPSRRPLNSQNPQPRTNEVPQQTPAKLKPLAPSQSHPQNQTSPLKEREDKSPSAEKKKQL
jgi:hypothetical protein